MGLEILKEILSDLVNSCINSDIDYITELLAADNVFNCHLTIKDLFGVDILPVINSIFAIAYWFLLLKFAWKAFNIYTLGVDGDEDSDPMVLVTNLLKALAISVGFGVLFETCMNIASQILSAIIGSLSANVSIDQIGWAILLSKVLGSGPLSLLLLIFATIYIILIIIINIALMIYEIQLVILRCGICFASAGLLDSDQGIFKPYIKKFFQISWSIILQVVCFKLSLLGLVNQNLLAAIIAMGMAIKAPQFLSEFIMTNQGGGGKLQQALYSFSIMRSFAR